MRSFWDSAADEAPGFYTATAHRRLDAEYFQAGKSESHSLVSMFDLPSGPEASLLEVGCGAGRMTQEFASMYSMVAGVDISPVMLSHARTALSGCPNVQLAQISGDGELPFGDESFDAVFSYIVLQHIPSKAIQERYIAEASRVLKTGGLAALQLRRSNVYARSRNAGARLVYMMQARKVGSPAWKGASLSKKRLMHVSLVGSTLTIFDTNLLHRWILIRKVPAAQGAQAGNAAST